MKKYYPVDFDEKGNAVLGNAKSNPTSNGFIPTTWVPGGGSDEGNGIKSITISPAITTTPALEYLFPIYWEDLTEEQKRDDVRFTGEPATALVEGATYTITATPTDSMFVADGAGVVSASAGAPITFNVAVEDGELFFGVTAVDSISAAPEKMFTVRVDINKK